MHSGTLVDTVTLPRRGKYKVLYEAARSFTAEYKTLVCICSKYEDDPCFLLFFLMSFSVVEIRGSWLKVATTQHRLQLSLNGPHCMSHLQVC